MDVGMEPNTGDNVSCDIGEYAAANITNATAFAQTCIALEENGRLVTGAMRSSCGTLVDLDDFEDSSLGFF